jgi:hypothetical protein
MTTKHWLPLMGPAEERLPLLSYVNRRLSYRRETAIWCPDTDPSRVQSTKANPTNSFR